MKLLDPYDGASARIGRIHSLYVIHGVELSPKDANVNIIKVTSNIPLPYVDEINGCSCSKEKGVSLGGQISIWKSHQYRLFSCFCCKA